MYDKFTMGMTGNKIEPLFTVGPHLTTRKCVNDSPNYNLASKQNISHIKAKPKSIVIFVTQWHRLSEHE